MVEFARRLPTSAQSTFARVCRASYIDRRVFDRFDAGVTIADTLERLADSELGDPFGRVKIERAVLDLISDEEPPPG
jgi:hypothetical protein